MQELSQYNFKIEDRLGKEGGKPDALRRREGDLPTAGDKRLTRNVGILLPKERYWDIPEREESRLHILETTGFRDKDEGEMQEASKNNNEIQDIKRNRDEGKKEMKGIALGLLLGMPRMPTHKAHAQTPAYQSVKKYEVQKIHLGLP